MIIKKITSVFEHFITHTKVNFLILHNNFSLSIKKPFLHWLAFLKFILTDVTRTFVY